MPQDLLESSSSPADLLAERKPLLEAWRDWVPTRQALAPEAEKSGPSLGSHIAGLGETALSVITGIPARIAGNLAGVVEHLATDSQAEGMKRADEIAAKYTYSPRSEGGKTQAKVLGETLGALPPIVPGQMGAVGPAARFAIAKAVPQLAEHLNELESMAAQNRARVTSLAAPTVKGINDARALGYVITPSKAMAGPIAQTAEGLAGGPRLEKLMALKNQTVSNDMIRRDVQLPRDVPISREALSRVRSVAGESYEAIKNVGFLDHDNSYLQDLRNISRSYDTAAKDYSHRSENPFRRVLNGLRYDEEGKVKPGVDASSAIEEIKLLRADADKAYKSGDTSLGRAYKDMARAIDDMMDRNLKRRSVLTKDPSFAKMVDEYHDARKLIAKTYIADKALNDTTGNIDARVYGREMDKGTPLTGGAMHVARFAKQFPKLAQPTDRIGATGPSFWDLALAGMKMRGIGAEALLLGARPITREFMATKVGQRMMRQPGQPNMIARRLQDAFAPTAEEAVAIGGIEQGEH